MRLVYFSLLVIYLYIDGHINHIRKKIQIQYMHAIIRGKKNNQKNKVEFFQSKAEDPIYRYWYWVSDHLNLGLLIRNINYEDNLCKNKFKF